MIEGWVGKVASLAMSSHHIYVHSIRQIRYGVTMSGVVVFIKVCLLWEGAVGVFVCAGVRGLYSKSLPMLSWVVYNLMMTGIRGVTRMMIDNPERDLIVSLIVIGPRVLILYFYFIAKSYTYQKYGIQHRYTIII